MTLIQQLQEENRRIGERLAELAARRQARGGIRVRESEADAESADRDIYESFRGMGLSESQARTAALGRGGMRFSDAEREKILEKPGDVSDGADAEATAELKKLGQSLGCGETFARGRR